jgi:YegS/Rv2252/BmrU family lipid kinase
MKIFLILNPGSNSGKSKRKFEEIFKILDNNKFSYEYKITSTLEDAYLFSKEANEKNFDIIIAVGGDGTINNVLNGFYDNHGKRISKSKFAVIYTGTSPDFCKSYSIPLNLEDAVKLIIKGNSKKISIGKILLFEKDNNQYINKKINYNDDYLKIKYFACCTNIGIGASISRNANKNRKYLGDFTGTFTSIIKSLISYKSSNYKILLDDTEKNISNTFNISIGKTKYIASGIKINNDLSEKDKRFYFLVVKELNIFNFPKVIFNLYNGKKINTSKQMELLYTNKIYINRSTHNNEIEFDGDPKGFLPCIIDTSEPLDLIVK